MFDVDGALVGYGGLAPEPLIELIAAGKAKDYPKARAIHDRLLPVTRSVYHRGSHMEGSVALKHGLVARGILEDATVRPPLLPLEPGAEVEIAEALRSAGLVGQPGETPQSSGRLEGRRLAAAGRRLHNSLAYKRRAPAAVQAARACGSWKWSGPMVALATAVEAAPSYELVIARLERLPISRELTIARIVIGSATFFDAYTVLAIAYAMPVLAPEWNLTPGQIGMVISAGYVGQVFGALFSDGSQNASVVSMCC